MADEVRDLEWLRRQFVIALACDDELFELLILKGGNALALVHEIGLRASLDLDYSLAAEPQDDQALGRRLESALKHSLGHSSLTVFDWNFSARPAKPADGQDPLWGGYLAEFKVIETKLWAKLGGDLDKARNCAWNITPAGGAPRKFRLELSRNERCEGAGTKEVGDGVTVRIYTPAMIAAEKLRSLCQQMQQYTHSSKRKARGRDFYDIHAVIIEASVNLASDSNLELIRQVFAAKRVPLGLLELIETELPFHEGEWDSVRDSIPAESPSDFKFYSDFVLAEVRKLEPLWIEDSP